jgi:hypothetical protein
MPTTTKGFRYPQYTDTPDIPRDIQALATDLDNYITNNPITINGTPVSLGGTASITGLPTQTSNSGKYLTTDGTSASWATINLSSYLTSSTAASTYAPISGPTFTGTVILPSTTSIGNVSSTEIGYVDGVTSAIQTQIDAKIAKSDITAKGAILVGTGAGTYSAQTVGTNGQVLTADSAEADGVKWATPESTSTLLTNA